MKEAPAAQIRDIQNVQHLHHEFIFVEPKELHEYWPEVRPGLEEVAKFGDAWIPEDVYTGLRRWLNLGMRGYQKMSILASKQGLLTSTSFTMARRIWVLL